MIKLRLQGTIEDINSFEKQIMECPKFVITESSDIFTNKGTNKFFRKYMEICNLENLED